MFLPKLEITALESKKQRDSIYRVSMIVANTGYMPTYGTREALARRRSEEILAVIECPDGVITPDAAMKIGHLEGFSAIVTQPMHGAMFRASDHNPCAKRVSWLVYGKPGHSVSVTVSTPRGGVAAETVVLQ